MRKTENGIVAQSEESITLITSYRLPHHDSRSFTFVQDDALPSYARIMESAAEKSSLAHAVRLRILARRNDSNRNRVRYKTDGSEPVVRTFVQNSCHNKCSQINRDFRISRRGK